MAATLTFKNTFHKLSEDLATILHQVEEQIGSLEFSDETRERLKARMEERLKEWRQTVAKIKAFRAELPKKSLRKDTLHNLKKSLDHYEKSIRASAHEFSTIPWSQHLKKLHEEATALAAQVRALPDNPKVRQLIEEGRALARRSDLQWGRKIFHTCNGLFGLWLWGYSGLSERTVIWILTAFFSTSVLTEVGRRLWPAYNDWLCKNLSGIMRERERTRISSATFFMGAILIVFLLFPRPVGILSLFYVSVGDTVAGIIGVVWGRHKISTHASLEGITAMFLTCALGTIFFVRFGLQGWTLGDIPLIFFSILCGIVAALSECTIKKFDDNVTIPLISAPLVWLLMRLFS